MASHLPTVSKHLSLVSASTGDVRSCHMRLRPALTCCSRHINGALISRAVGTC
jgi:hypothetical protein